jgi:AcrR family transcriptional regulator
MLTDRRSLRREAAKAEIVDAAWDICRQHGLAALSLRELAKRVGMQAPSLYSYFDSKFAIYDAMFAQGARDFVDQTPDLTGVTDVAEGCKIKWRFFIGFCTADPARYQLLFQRTIPGFEPSAESFQISIEGLNKSFRWFKSVGITDPRLLDMYTAIGTGLTDQQISNDPGGDRWARLVDAAAGMFAAYAVEASEPKKRRKSS